LNSLKQALTEYLGNRGVIREIEMKLTYRGSFGVGSTFGQIPFEVGLYIHPYFNVPYIPASSIKGAIRNAYYYYLVNHENENHDKAERECNKLFGDSNFAGLVGFTDALPIQEGENGYILYPDIINPHYKDARNEMEVEPKPIIFLTVAPGTSFKFYMYVIKEREKEKGSKKEKREIEMGEKKDLALKPIPNIENLGKLDLALLYGLSMGIGAKTALGYSQFVVVTYE
jgi:CRISPR-associated protein Cmr6